MKLQRLTVPRAFDRPGAHLKVWRGLYWHHAIYVGNGWLIEFGSGVFGGVVAYVAWSDFAKNHRVEVVHHQRSLPPHEVMRRAESKLGNDGFSLLSANCEHFANWCATDQWESSQAVALASMSKAACVVLVVAAAISVIGRGGYRIA